MTNYLSCGIGLENHFEIPLEESPFQVGMYQRVFELLLRLKANYLWPASGSGRSISLKAHHVLLDILSRFPQCSRIFPPAETRKVVLIRSNAVWASMFDVDGLQPEQKSLPKQPIPVPTKC